MAKTIKLDSELLQEDAIHFVHVMNYISANERGGVCNKFVCSKMLSLYVICLFAAYRVCGIVAL